MNERRSFAGRDGRLIVPAAARLHLGIGPMGEAIFVLNSDGTVTLRRSGRKRLMLEEVLGAIPALPNETIDLDREIEEAISEAIQDKFGWAGIRALDLCPPTYRFACANYTGCHSEERKPVLSLPKEISRRSGLRCQH